MSSASMVAVPRSVVVMPVAVAARAAEDRRNARFFRPVAVAACGGGDDHQPMPASLRAIQAKRKLAVARRGVPPPRAAATNAAECAVAALVKAVGVVHGAAAGGAVAWVVRKVHDFQSPDLAVGLIWMLESCLGTAVEADWAIVATAQANNKPDDDDEGDPRPDYGDEEEDKEAVPDEDLPQLFETDMEKELWAKIGIMHGGSKDNFEDLDEDEVQEINSARARRRKAGYERVIAGGGANSLILSNYAQLLYEFDKDMKRAEMYFKQAVALEPADGEARRRYAIFLWHVRDDLAGAEDMFTDAIEQEPESTHIRSSYAWFLWMTGGVETCLIDSSSRNIIADGVE